MKIEYLPLKIGATLALLWFACIVGAALADATWLEGDLAIAGGAAALACGVGGIWAL